MTTLVGISQNRGQISAVAPHFYSKGNDKVDESSSSFEQVSFVEKGLKPIAGTDDKQGMFTYSGRLQGYSIDLIYIRGIANEGKAIIISPFIYNDKDLLNSAKKIFLSNLIGIILCKNDTEEKDFQIIINSSVGTKLAAKKVIVLYKEKNIQKRLPDMQVEFFSEEKKIYAVGIFKGWLEEAKKYL